MSQQEAVIVSTARTPIGRAYRGAFNDTEAPVLGGHVIRAALAKAGVDGAEVDDVILGIAAQQGTQGYNLGRLCTYTAGLPESVAGMTIDRMCASGLMAIASAAKSIMVGEHQVAVAGGLESISLTQNKYKNSYRSQSKAVLEAVPTAYIQMIETAELVAERRPAESDIAPLVQASRDMEKALKTDDLDGWAAADERFHRHLVELSGNRLLAEIVGSYWDRAHRARMFTLRLRPKPVNSTREHMALVERIRAGDARGAVEANRAHRGRASRELLEIFERYRLSQL
jgi:acetyl-CoA C-acetyltransferase